MVKADAITRLMERGYRVKVSLSSFSVLQMLSDNLINLFQYQINRLDIKGKLLGSVELAVDFIMFIMADCLLFPFDSYNEHLKPELWTLYPGKSKGTLCVLLSVQLFLTSYISQSAILVFLHCNAYSWLLITEKQALRAPKKSLLFLVVKSCFMMFDGRSS